MDTMKLRQLIPRKALLCLYDDGSGHLEEQNTRKAIPNTLFVDSNMESVLSEFNAGHRTLIPIKILKSGDKFTVPGEGPTYTYAYVDGHHSGAYVDSFEQMFIFHYDEDTLVERANAVD